MRLFRRVESFIRWVAIAALLFTIALWGLSYFRCITYSQFVAGPLPATTPTGQAVNTALYRLHHLERGAIILNMPVTFTLPASPPKWKFGNFFAGMLAPVSTLVPTYTLAPAPFGPFVTTIVPLWIPFLLFGVTVVLLWRREFWRRRWSRKQYYKVVRERLTKGVARCFGVAAFFAAFVATVAVSEFIVISVDRALYPKHLIEILRDSFHISETASLAMLLFVWFLIPYLVARVVHRWARWKTCYDEVPRCVRCYYELTGNISGRCPECGTVICRPGHPEEQSHGLV